MCAVSAVNAVCRNETNVPLLISSRSRRENKSIKEKQTDASNEKCCFCFLLLEVTVAIVVPLFLVSPHSFYACRMQCGALTIFIYIYILNPFYEYAGVFIFVFLSF